ncbi:hypothetical protein [Prosthecobacter sp.]|uniref:hypothetical protein n=1 Tax=Prosthecobacter sp. TaxID=1965333 RepID=UPI00378327FE
MSSETFWKSRTVRKIRGVTVSFYRRYEGSNFTMDFKWMKKRVRELTDCATVKEAEEAAKAKLQKMQEAGNGVEQMRAGQARRSLNIATVKQIHDAAKTGDKICSDGAMRAYLSSWLRLARVVNDSNPWSVTIDQVLTKENVLRFYSLGQGGKEGAVNRVDKLDCNSGLNACLRGVKALFRPDMIDAKFAGLHVPDVAPIRAMWSLPEPDHSFAPWDHDVYAAMEKASTELRTMQIAGPLAPGMLVKSVYASRGTPLHELGDKAGILQAVGADSARVAWALDGVTVTHEVPLDRLRAVKLDYAELWLVNTMLRRLGLRNKELLAAKREWIEQRPDKDGKPQWVLSIRKRADFDPLKDGAPRNLVLDDELREILLKREGLLIAPTLANEARKELVERLHNTWLRQFIPDRTKGNHELRMWAGSIVYMRSGLAAASYFLGHKSQVTTERFYATWFQNAEALDGEAVGRALVAEAA